MPPSSSTYSDWKAPAEDGEIVVSPEPKTLAEQTRENHHQLSNDETRIHGVPLRELRQQQRLWIGHLDADQPLIASGHQTELYHPGVWAKDVMASNVAARLNGAAYHFAVDTDQPKHLHFRWPGTSLPLTDDPSLNTADWTGQLESPSPAHLQSLRTAITAAERGWSFRSNLEPMIDSLRKLALESPALPIALTNAQHAFDWSVGLRHHAMITSPIWFSEPYLIFLHHLLSNAGEFAKHYNAALEGYRTENGIRSTMRPMPDLALFEDSCEAPFWLDDLTTGERTRPTVFKRDDGWVLKLTEGREFYFDPSAGASDAGKRLSKWLTEVHHRIAPRALVLTLYLRLFVTDQFIHGIGGGRYDQVTDRLIQSHFGIQPPRFSVTTATLFFPGAVGQSRACMPCVVQQAHYTKHKALGEQKRQYLARIEAAPRNSIDRRAAFYDMHRELNSAWSAGGMSDWDERVRDSKSQMARDKQLFDRELFYALQPDDRLQLLIEKYAKHFKA